MSAMHPFNESQVHLVNKFELYRFMIVVPM